ncbi:MAG TPA: HEAT repeat domain-containing protein, partial [Planctomycetota bacterium]|nr:HEAT repeat domain-containing protein [Planctomycetota bacterium]
KLVFSDEPKVLEFGVLALTFGRGRRGGGQGGQGGGSERRVSMLDLIAKHSPADWARVVVKTIGDSEEEVRKAAALALAALQDSAFIPDLTKRYQDKDETAAVRAVLLRALVELEPKSSKHVRAIEKLVASSKDEALRVQAIVAAAKLENRKAVTAILGRGLADASALVRQTTAYVIASRRDEALLSNLRFVAENEADAPTKTLLEAAIAAVDDGPLSAFTDLLESIGLKR